MTGAAKPKRGIGWGTWTLGVVGVICVAALAFFAVSFRLLHSPSGAMSPTLVKGDYFLGERISGADAKPGDIIVYNSSKNGRTDLFVKRVIATAGQRVAFTDGVPSVDGVPLKQDKTGEAANDFGMSVVRYREHLGGRSYLIEVFKEAPADRAIRDVEESTVPANTLYAVGDARDNSADSRTLGPVALSEVRYRVVRVFSQGDDTAPD